MALYTIHLFAGAGGGILADLLLGHTPIAACEIEEYPRKILLQRQLDGVLPVFPIWDDVTTLRKDNPACSDAFREWSKVSDNLAICGGFPCQDISSSGKGQGLSGERSGLWSEFARIIREVGPGFVFVENSPLLTIRGLGVVLGDLAQMGYNAKWGVLGAEHAGGIHRRHRIWILANSSKIRLQWGRNKDKEPPPSILQHEILPPLSLRPKRMENKLSESCVLRKGDDVANGLDRIKAIGNGQVPLSAAQAWRFLS